MYIYNKNHETMFYSVTKCSFTLLWCYCVIQYVYSYWPPKPEAQFPEEVPPPAVHSVLVVQTPCFTLMSEVVQTSLGNWTMLNSENPRRGGGEITEEFQHKNYIDTFSPVESLILQGWCEAEREREAPALDVPPSWSVVTTRLTPVSSLGLTDGQLQQQ